MESIKDKLSEYRQLFDDLTSQREILEIEADAINSELTSPTAIGGPPVDHWQMQKASREQTSIFTTSNRREND